MRMRMIKQNPCLHLQNECWWIFKIQREERKQTICTHLDAPGNRGNFTMDRTLFSVSRKVTKS